MLKTVTSQKNILEIHFPSKNKNKHFDAVALDVDEMWNIFKTKIDSGVTQFIPLTSIQDFTVLNGKGR